MKTMLAIATLLSMTATANYAIAGGFPNRVHYINSQKISAAMYKGGRVIEDEGLIVIANRGVQRGSEMHDKTNHVFIIVDGEADFEKLSGGQKRRVLLGRGHRHK